jgi:hypothetical protein
MSRSGWRLLVGGAVSVAGRGRNGRLVLTIWRCVGVIRLPVLVVRVLTLSGEMRVVSVLSGWFR